MKYLVLVALVGCGPANRTGNGDDGTGSGIDASTIDPPPGGDNCSAAAKLVYVVDEGNALYSFQPETKVFTKIGGANLNCPTQGIDPNTLMTPTPFSMGVDRNAVAWVLYSDGELFNVDTTTLACTATSFNSSSFTQFGMGFSTDAMGGAMDTLYIAGGQSVSGTQAQLATLNTSTMSTMNIAKVTGQPELTGNSNAELWGFFPSDTNGTTMPRVEQINKTTGAAIKNFPLPTLKGAPMAWAFAFYGGDYWVFLMKGTETTTTVYQIDGATGAVKGSTPTSRVIVGAGVSTCAPVVIF